MGRKEEWSIYRPNDFDFKLSWVSESFLKAHFFGLFVMNGVLPTRVSWVTEE